VHFATQRSKFYGEGLSIIFVLSALHLCSHSHNLNPDLAAGTCSVEITVSFAISTSCYRK